MLFALVMLWHAPAHAALKFGHTERIRFVAATPLTDKDGTPLFLARKIVEKSFLLPYSIEDQGYVLGISGQSRRYHPLPEGDTLAALQRSGQLPTPLPPFELDTLDRLIGHALWLALAGLIVYGAVHRAVRRRRPAAAGRAAPERPTASQVDTPSATPAPPVPTLPSLGVRLPLRLRPSRLKMLALLAVCAVFVALGVWMSRTEPLMGYLCAGFFGLGLPVFALQLLPGVSYLELRRDGFVFRSLFKQATVRWLDIGSLHVVRVQGYTMVGWNYVPGRGGAGAGHTLSKTLSGVHGALPDTYGMKGQALADLMDRIRLHALSAARGSISTSRAPA